jgi:hypothetical protein
MEWQRWGNQLAEVLGLTKSPVGVTYTDAAPRNASTGKCRETTLLLMHVSESNCYHRELSQSEDNCDADRVEAFCCSHT